MAQKQTEGGVCPFARTTDLLKEQWTLAIFREVLAGRPSAFGDFLRIPGMEPEVLLSRLDALTEDSVFEEYTGDGGARSYRLTEAGMRLVIILRALGDWADQFAGGDPERPV